MGCDLLHPMGPLPVWGQVGVKGQAGKFVGQITPQITGVQQKFAGVPKTAYLPRTGWKIFGQNMKQMLNFLFLLDKSACLEV